MTRASSDGSYDDLEVAFVVPGGSILGTAARRAFVGGVEDYALHVLDDASAFEDTSRADSRDEPEITATHVRDAIRAQQTRSDRRSLSRKILLVIARLVLFALAAIVGLAGNNFPDPAAIAWFTASLTAGLFILGITEVMEWSR